MALHAFIVLVNFEQTSSFVKINVRNFFTHVCVQKMTYLWFFDSLGHTQIQFKRLIYKTEET